MLCDKCGQNLPNGSKFCFKCGNKVEILEKQTPYKKHFDTTSNAQNRKRVSRKTSIAISCVVVVAVILILSFRKMSDEDFFKLCASGTTQEIEAAIKKGANIRVSDERGDTPLRIAALSNTNAEVITTLIKHGADVNSKNKTDRTPLSGAANSNTNPEVITALIENGADVNYINKEGVTPLMYAAANNSNPEVILILLKNGANVNYKNTKGETALIWATEKNKNPEVISVLRRAESVENFLRLCQSGTLQEIEEAIKSGADVNAQREDGATALMFAAEKNSNPEIISVLLRNGADVNARHERGLTALMIAAANNPNPEVTSVLLRNGAEINASIPNGWTALMFAARDNSNPKIVSVLLQNGADVNAGTPFGRKRAIDFAAENDNLINTDIYQQLLMASTGITGFSLAGNRTIRELFSHVTLVEPYSFSVGDLDYQILGFSFGTHSRVGTGLNIEGSFGLALTVGLYRGATRYGSRDADLALYYSVKPKANVTSPRALTPIKIDFAITDDKGDTGAFVINTLNNELPVIGKPRFGMVTWGVYSDAKYFDITVAGEKRRLDTSILPFQSK